jgi:hypothetical protein
LILNVLYFSIGQLTIIISFVWVPSILTPTVVHRQLKWVQSIDQETPLPSSTLRFLFPIPTFRTTDCGRVVSTWYVMSHFRTTALVPEVEVIPHTAYVLLLQDDSSTIRSVTGPHGSNTNHSVQCPSTPSLLVLQPCKGLCLSSNRPSWFSVGFRNCNTYKVHVRWDPMSPQHGASSGCG